MPEIEALSQPKRTHDDRAYGYQEGDKQEIRRTGCRKDAEI
jgi:hypothetical protein